MASGNFGERLKRERELREVTLDEITSATRIGPRFLLALENEDWEKLPGGVFNRGFVRSVARYLGLDEEGLLAEYDLAHTPQIQADAEQKENRIPSPPRWFPLALFLGFLLLLAVLITGGIYGWRYYRARRARKFAASSLSATTTQTAPHPMNPASAGIPVHAAATAANAQPLDLLVSCSAATRIRVVAAGKLLLDAELPPGDNRHFAAQDEFEVGAADSSAVLLELNGKAMPPIGAPGASGTIKLNRQDLRLVSSGTSQP